jgi:sialate O-acetylesterase
MHVLTASFRRVGVCFSSVAIALACSTLSLRALELPALFSDGMILQRDKPVPVWGWSEAGQEVTVQFAGQEKKAKAGADGRWEVSLDPMDATVKGDMIISGDASKTIKDVLIGEVWICSGQSNMDAYTYTLEPGERGAEEFTDVRFFVVRRGVGATPQRDVNASWTQCGTTEQCMCSAVGYLFARDLRKRLGVPVGIVQATWGDTRAEFWTPLDALKSDPALAEYIKTWEQMSPQVTTWADYEKRWVEWNANKEGAEPAPPQKIPSSIFNGMVAPLAPFAARGVLWYQGESNAYQASEYRKIFPTMIEAWRAAWRSPEWPFLYVQLPNYEKQDTTPPNMSPWSELREAQEATLSLPGTEMAVTIDIGGEDIHPRNKPEVARRLMNIALAKVYGEKVPYTGPRFDAAKFESDRAQISFKHVEGGLKIRDGEVLKGFALAGEDRKWHWADATIEGDKVVVRSTDVPRPVAVRYAWAHNPECNLINDTGLPAAPFRTDTW